MSDESLDSQVAPRVLAARERALVESEARLARIIETMAEGVVILDREGRFVELNAAAERILRLSRAELQGNPGASQWRWLTLDGAPLPLDLSAFQIVRRTGRPVHELEFMIEHDDGMRVIVAVNAAPLADADGAFAGAVATFTDITERKLLEAQLRYQAYTDELTGLANRVQLVERLQAALRGQPDDASVAVLYLDLDGFKAVNDRHGHEAGDVLLGAVGQRLRALVRPGDLVGRLGGDEFMVLLDGVEDAATAVDVGERIRAGMEEPFIVAGQSVRIGASIGVALSGPGGESASAILRAADQALYHAKHGGRNRVVLSPIGAVAPEA